MVRIRSPGLNPARPAGEPGVTVEIAGGRQDDSDCAAMARSSIASECTTRRMSGFPATVMVIVSADSFKIPLNTSPQTFTATPLTARMVSPGASCVSGASAGTNPVVSTFPTRVSGSKARPFFIASPLKTTQAKRAFMVTPARMMIIRFQTGFASKYISGGTITSGVPPSSALLVASSSAVAIFT